MCTRRPRIARRGAAVDVPPRSRCTTPTSTRISYETDRARFIGRGNTLRQPGGADRSQDRSSDSDRLGARPDRGDPLHPHLAARDRPRPIDMVTGVGADARRLRSSLIDKYRDRRLADRVFDLAWTHSQVVLRQINASQADAQLYERLAGLIIYAIPALRADAQVLLQNRRGQSGLWGQAISGDHPIVLLPHRRRRPTSTWSARWCRPTPTGA